jgi:hypothetical protein
LGVVIINGGLYTEGNTTLYLDMIKINTNYFNIFN